MLLKQGEFRYANKGNDQEEKLTFLFITKYYYTVRQSWTGWTIRKTADVEYRKTRKIFCVVFYLCQNQVLVPSIDPLEIRASTTATARS